MNVDSTILATLVEVILTLILGAFAYGKLVNQIKSNKELAENKFEFMQKEIETVQAEKTEHVKDTQEIQKDLAELKSDIKHILKTIDQLNFK